MVLAKVFVLVLLVASVVVGQKRSIDDLWREFQVTYHKKYPTQAEADRRFQTFKSNVAFIEQHNLEASLGRQLYTVKINEFADSTPGEFFMLINGVDPNKLTSSSESGGKPIGFYLKTNSDPRNYTLYFQMKQTRGATVDWRNIVTPVKNQGKVGCGACYAFSATGAIEALHAKKTGKLMSLSEQNLIDCSKNYGNYGCEGGTMGAAFYYVMQNKGINTEQIYPYEAVARNCRFIRNDPNLVKISSYVQVRANDEANLESVLVSRGPVSAAMDASRRGLQFYNKGIYYDTECKSDRKSLNHAVLVVGCGVETNGQEYWLIKNSWGTEWGDQGYFKLAKNKKNHCGIAASAIIPI